MTEKLALPSALVTACVPEFLRLSNADVTDGAPKLLNHFDASLAAPLMTLLTQPHAPPFDFAASDFALAGFACSLDFACALGPVLAVVVLVGFVCALDPVLVVLVGFVCALDPVLAVVVLVGFVCALDPVLAVVCSAGLAAHAGSTPVRLNSSAALILSVKYGGLSANVDVGCTEPAPYHASGITNFLPVAA
jgi:hypothetical protein